MLLSNNNTPNKQEWTTKNMPQQQHMFTNLNNHHNDYLYINPYKNNTKIPSIMMIKSGVVDDVANVLTFWL